MTVEIFVGDCLEQLKRLHDNSVHTCITSPPYFNLRSYLPDDHPDKSLEIGLELLPADYIARLVAVFREVRRVLRDDGTLWLNIGDSYAAGKTGRDDSGDNGRFRGPRIEPKQRRAPPNYKNKDLLMIPSEVAIALRDDGWYLRSEIIWHKLNPMPEGGAAVDRPTSAHEKIFLLAKSLRYYYDADAVREGLNERNMRNVWPMALVSEKSEANSHFAIYNSKLIEPCVRAGTSGGGACAMCGKPLERVSEASEQDRLIAFADDLVVAWQKTCGHNGGVVPCIVLDPFFGTGSTAVAAARYGQDAIGVEMNREFVEVAAQRLEAEKLSVIIN